MRLNLASHADILIATHWRARAIFLSYSVPEATKHMIYYYKKPYGKSDKLGVKIA